MNTQSIALTFLILGAALTAINAWQSGSHLALAARLQGVLESLSRVSASIAPSTVGVGATPKSSAGGGVSVVPWMDLTALPAWSQKTAYLPDGTLDPQAYNDCGETCVSMIVASVHGVAVGPGSVRANNGGVGRGGLTTADDLVRMLGYYNVAAHVASPAKEDLPKVLGALALSGQPAVVLGTWPTPGGTLHWMISVSNGPKWGYMNPWGGVRSWWDWANTQANYAGSIVVVDGHLHYDMSAHQEPM